MTDSTGSELAASGADVPESPLRQLWDNFKKSSLAMAGAAMVVLYVFLALSANVITPADPVKQFDAPEGIRNPMPPMSRSAEGHLMVLGSDKFGRDILARSLYGTRNLLGIALTSVGLALLLGYCAGAAAAYNSGNWVDELIMRGADIFLSFPTLVLAIALLGALGSGAIEIGWVTIGNETKIIFVIAVTYAPRVTRVARAVVLQELGLDYVTAARVAGAGGVRVIVSEVLVNTVPPMIVQASLMMATSVLTSASLGFLGLGLQPPKPSLGVMLNEAREFLFLGAWWYSLVPGVFISVAILGFNLLGDGLRDSLDPRLARAVR